jgi:hypothetical protein
MSVTDWDLDDDATMRVGPARNGLLLEIGISGVDTHDPGDLPRNEMPRPIQPIPAMKEPTMPTDEELRRHVKLAEDLDPSTTPAKDASDLRAIGETAMAIRANEAKLRELVQLARAHGRSWGEIAISLGVSRQAAHERFAEKVNV